MNENEAISKAILNMHTTFLRRELSKHELLRNSFEVVMNHIEAQESLIAELMTAAGCDVPSSVVADDELADFRFTAPPETKTIRFWNAEGRAALEQFASSVNVAYPQDEDRSA